MDIIAQLSQIYTGASFFSPNVVKIVCNKSLFTACTWDNSQVNTFLYFIKAHIKIDKSVWIYYDKLLRLIDQKWRYEAVIYIKGKRFPE